MNNLAKFARRLDLTLGGTGGGGDDRREERYTAENLLAIEEMVTALESGRIGRVEYEARWAALRQEGRLNASKNVGISLREFDEIYRRAKRVKARRDQAREQRGKRS